MQPRVDEVKAALARVAGRRGGAGARYSQSAGISASSARSAL